MLRRGIESLLTFIQNSNREYPSKVQDVLSSVETERALFLSSSANLSLRGSGYISNVCSKRPRMNYNDGLRPQWDSEHELQLSLVGEC